MSGARGFVVRADEAEAVWSLGGRFATLADGDATDGHATLLAAEAWRSTEPPLHVHHNEHEAWFVLEGQMTLVVGEETLVAPAGSFVFAPRGVPHAFTVDIEPSRVLLLTAPAGFEGFARELGVPATGQRPAVLEVPPPEVMGPVGERYGIEVVGPPLRVMRDEQAEG